MAIFSPTCSGLLVLIRGNPCRMLGLMLGLAAQWGAVSQRQAMNKLSWRADHTFLTQRPAGLCWAAVKIRKPDKA